MSSFGVVLDSCVLVAAPVRDTLLRAAEHGLYRPHWSEDILTEVHTVLVREQMTSVQQAAYLIDTLKTVFPEAMVAGHDQLIDSMNNDAGDRHVLAAAVFSGAQSIITNNIRHFPPESLEDFGIEAMTPDEYLLDLYDLRPEVLQEIVKQQGAALNPPRSAAQICEVLTNHAPGFAHALLADIRREHFTIDEIE